MENSEGSIKKVARKSAALLEDKITQLEHELVQAKQNVQNKECLVKMQADQLKKLEEIHIHSLDEIEILSYTNRKTIEELENMRLILTEYQTIKNQMKNVECQTDFKNQESKTNYETILEQQERTLNTIINMRKDSRKVENLRESHTQCNLLSSDPSKLIINLLETELTTLRIQIEKYRRISKFFIEDTCEDRVIQSLRASNDGRKSLRHFNNMRVLSPVPEKEECDERVSLLEEECEFLRKSLDEVKRSFSFNMNKLSDAELTISKFDSVVEERRLENERLNSQLGYYKRQFIMLVMKMDNAIGKVKRYDDTKLKTPMLQSTEIQSPKFIENIDINEYFANFLETVNQTKSEKDALYNTLLDHQKISQRNLNELFDENNVLKKKIAFLTQQKPNDNLHHQQKCTFENQLSELVKNSGNKLEDKEESIESTKDIIIEELNHLAVLGEEGRLSTSVMKICGKLKAYYHVQINEIKALEDDIKCLENKCNELVKVNDSLRECCEQSSKEKETCVTEINNLSSSFNIDEKIDYNCKEGLFENNLKHVCSLLGGNYARVRRSEREYAINMEAIAREIIQLMVSLGYKDGVSCYNFTNKNMLHQVKTICTKIKIWHNKQIDKSKHCGKFEKSILESFVRETNNWLNQLKTKNIAIDYDHMETVDLQIRKTFTELQTAVKKAHANDLETENFELIKLNENLIKEIEALKNNPNLETIERDVLKQLLQLMNVFDESEGISAKAEYTIHNVKDICSQIKACYQNRLRKEAVVERNLEILKLQEEKLLKENNYLMKEIEILRSEEFDQDDIKDLIALIKGKEVVMRSYSSKKESLKSIFREIRACFEKGVHEKRVIKHQLEEIKSTNIELREENAELKKELGVIQEIVLLEEPCLKGDNLSQQIRLILVKLRNQIEKVHEANQPRVRYLKLNEVFMKQIKKMLMLINIPHGNLLVFEEDNPDQIEDVFNHISDLFLKNINEGFESRQLLEAQIKRLQSTMNLIKNENERLEEDRELKDKCLHELNELNRSVTNSEEFIVDAGQVSFVFKRIKMVFMQKFKFEQTCKTCFENLLKAINQIISCPAFPTLLFSNYNNPEEQLVEAFAALERIILSELKSKNTEITSVNEQFEIITKSLEDKCSVILELHERIQFLENDTDLESSKNELKENMKKIKENASVASNLCEKYLDLMEKYYKQNSELEKQNHFMKEHISVIKDYKCKLKESEKTIAELRREVAQLNESIQTMSCKIEDQSEQLNKGCDLQVEFNKMIENLEKVMREKETLQKELARLKSAKLDITRAVEERNGDIRKLKDEIFELVEENRALNEEVRNFEELQKKQEEDIIRISEEKELYEEKSNTSLVKLQQQLQTVVAEKEELEKRLEHKIIAERDQLQQKLNIYKIESKRLNFEVIQLKEEIKTLQQQNENLDSSYGGEMKQIVDECTDYKTKLNRLSKYIEDRWDYEHEFELLKNHLAEENENLKRKLSTCNDVLTDFNFVLRSQNIQERIVLLRVFIQKRETHIRILLEQKEEACKLLEILIDNSKMTETEINDRESISSAVSAAQSTVEMLFMSLSKQDDRYNETSLEITNNDRFLKDKLKDLEDKKNMLKISLQDIKLTVSDKATYPETQSTSSLT